MMDADFGNAVELTCPETGTVYARWTLKNWQKCHQILVESKDRFVFHVPNVAVFQFFLSPNQTGKGWPNDKFQYYSLVAKVRRLHSDPINMLCYTVVSTNPDVVLSPESVSILQLGKLEKELEFQENLVSVGGRLGHFCESKLGTSPLDPRDFKEPAHENELHTKDAIYIHFFIKILPLQTFSKGVVPAAIPNTFQGKLFYNGLQPDLHLLAGDGAELPVHRGILAANINRLGNMFSFDDMHKQKLLSFPHISSRVMKIILQFAYTGEVQHSMLQAATADFPEILQVTSKHGLKQLIAYFSGKSGKLCNSGNARELHALCTKYSLTEGKDAVVNFVKAFPYQCLEKWSSTTPTPDVSEEPLLTQLAKLSKFEKVSDVPTYYSVKAGKNWIIKKPGQCHGCLSYIYTYDLPVNDQVALRFFLNETGLSVETAFGSEDFIEKHLLIDYAAELEIIYEDDGIKKGYTQCSSKFKFMDGSSKVLLEPNFSYHKHIVEFWNSVQVKIKIDVEIFLKADVLSNSKNGSIPSDIVTLQLKDGIGFPVEKSKLAARNPVFQAMFYGGLKESSEKIISIPDLSSAAMIVIVEYIYSGTIHQNWKQNVGEVLEGATKYMLSGLLSHVDANLKDLCTSENMMDLYKLAKFYGLQGAQQDIAEFLSENTALALENLAFID